MPSLNQVTILKEIILSKVDVDGSVTSTQEGVSLTNDEDSPGANKVYGTDESGNKGWVAPKVILGIAASDETTALTAGAGKITFRMPHVITLTEVRASLVTAQTSGNIFTVDILKGGVSILSTKLTIDNGEKTSTSATPSVISDTSLTDDSEMSISITQIGDGTAKGLKIWLIGI